jgi:hypothetical protein
MASPGSIRFFARSVGCLADYCWFDQTSSGHEFTCAANPLKGTGLPPLRALASRPENEYHFKDLNTFLPE